MSAVRELVMEHACGQTRLAALEDGKLCEIYFERGERSNLSGNIYAGRVQNILPGMNAAFVDIGLNKNGFLYAGDIRIDTREQQALKKQLDGARIERMLSHGKMIVVQVTKEPGGSKGPRLSGNLSLPGRLTVLLPTIRYAGVSRKITDEAARDRLYTLASRLSEKNGAGVIIRTAGESATETEIIADYERSLREWARIQTEAQHSAQPRLIRADGDLELFAVRDLLDETVTRLRTDDAACYERLVRCAEALAPELAGRISLQKCDCPLFDLLRVDQQLETAFLRRVLLKSGGTLVIDETEALTVIDVNTAKFVGKGSLDDTIFALNCEAAEEIVRQLRLRDIGGIVIIDFIDMRLPEQREALLARMEEALKRDHNRTNLLGMTKLGLVELTRKKQRRPLSKLLQRDCASCGGSGRMLTNESIAYSALREIWRRRRMGDTTAYRIVTGAQTAEWLERIGLTDAAARIEIGGANRDFALVPDAHEKVKNEEE